MANFCQNCGNKLKSTDKFCTKCGTPVTVTEQNKQTPISSENIQETVENLKETVGNVSTVVKEKEKQAVQQSQEYLQSEEFQNTKENVIEKAKQAAQYSKDIVQNEEFRNEQADVLKEKAKQAQEYLKSEEFQNVKTETVNKTKGVIKNFFSCNINSNDDYIKAEKQRKYCLYTIFAVIAATIFLIPFYDEWYWYSGMWESIMHSASTLSIISKVFIAPVCIIAFIKYYIVTKGTKEYKIQNSNIQAYNTNINKKAMLIILVICIVCVPVVNKINDIMYHSDSSSTSSYSNYNDLVEVCDGESGLQFKLTVDEYIEKYNNNTVGASLSKKAASRNNNDEVISYSFDIGYARVMLLSYKNTDKIREIRYICTQSSYNKDTELQLEHMSNVFGIIDNTIDVSKMKDIIHNASSSNNYYDNGINYGLSGDKDNFCASMLAVTKEVAENLYGSTGSTDNKTSNLTQSSNKETSSSSTSSGTVATDFKIIGGSDNVNVNESGTNYTVTCPYCGYIGGPTGTHEIQSELSKHEAAETADINMTSMCASEYQGGCRKTSKYYVTVKFE